MKTPNHSIPLPAVIASYWAAANAGHVEAAAACFAQDAVVHDEGHRHVGPTAIAAWVNETTRKSQPVVEPLRVEEKSGRHLVTARVSGAFLGSPVELEFAFTLVDGKIVNLEIQ